MANGNGINNRDKKTYKDKKKGKFLKQKKQKKKEKIYNLAPIEEFTVESDGTSYKSSDKPKKRLMVNRKLRKTYNRVVEDSLSEGMSEKSTQVNKNVKETAFERWAMKALDDPSLITPKTTVKNNNIASAAARASSEFITEALGLAAANTTSNVTSHIGKANKALGEAIRTKKYDPAANEAVRRIKEMDKPPTMMYGKPSSPLKGGSPLAKYGCSKKH